VKSLNIMNFILHMDYLIRYILLKYLLIKMNKITQGSLLTVLAFLLIISTIYCKLKRREQFKIGIITDIHIDPYYDPEVSVGNKCMAGSPKESDTSMPSKFGKRGCNSPKDLFLATLDKLHDVLPKPDLIVVTGDIAPHSLTTKNYALPLNETAYKMIKTQIDYFIDEAEKVFPDTPIALTPGNNDYFFSNNVPKTEIRKDYNEFLQDHWFDELEANDNYDSKENEADIEKMGCYTMELRHNFELISINSIYFSPYNPQSNDEGGPERVLAWLEEKLEDAEKHNRKVLIVQHYAHGANMGISAVEQVWAVNYQDQYLKLLLKYADTVSIVLAGHIHRFILNAWNATFPEADDTHKTHFKRIYFGNVLASRAVSPRDGNNPGFGILYYEGNNFDYPAYFEDYTLDIAKSMAVDNEEDLKNLWVKELNTKEDLGLENLSAESVYEFTERLKNDAELANKYKNLAMGFE